MIAATVLAVASCSWTNPGHDRFTGNDAAVEDFQGIPAPVRAVLRERIRKHDFDDIATITNDQIKGAADYDDLRDMHFGKNKMCKSVERKWKPEHKEVGIVYCESDHCVIVPTVCGNIALVTRRRPAGAVGRPPSEGAVGGGGGGSAPALVADPMASLDNMPPTGAGVRNDPSTFANGSGIANTASTSSGAVATASSIPVLASGQGISFGNGYYSGGFVGGGLVVPSAVPEPATWATLLAGLAALGFASRRRRG